MKIFKLILLIILLILLVLGIWGFIVEPRYLLDVQTHDVEVPNLGSDWEGKKVALLADFQVGMWWGNTGMIAVTFNFEGVLDSAFNQIRQFSGGSPAVIIRLMEALTTIHEFTSKESHKKAVIKHAEMVLSSGKQNFKEKNDLDDLSERAVKILNI